MQSWARLLLLAGWLSAAGAFADEPTTPAPPEPENSRRVAVLPVPPDLAEPVAFAERRGRELYEHDQAAWHGTDAAKPASRRWRRRLVGWITVPRAEGERPLVRFLSEPEPSVYASRVDVVLGVTEAKLEEHDPAIPLPDDQQALARARALAIAERKRQCTPTLNSVVLRDAGGEIHVYLLAATSDPDVIVLAGHDLARVSPDGRTVVAWRSFSNTCMNGELKEDAVMQFVTHVLDPTPTEVHVFTSLNYRAPLAVGTSRGIWMVDAGEIRMLDIPQKEQP
jgi:hypothetical protein